jgi:D-alanyl-D-alanine carboxypeptidase
MGTDLFAYDIAADAKSYANKSVPITIANHMRNVVFAIALALALLLGEDATGGEAKRASVTPKPEVRSAAALVLDSTTGEVLFERDAGHVAPIASITKLMTALVVLDAQQPLDEMIEITNADRWKGKGAHSRLPVGMKLTRADLLKLALLASENRAAVVLARNYPGGKSAFIRTMNPSSAPSPRFKATKCGSTSAARSSTGTPIY